MRITAGNAVMHGAMQVCLSHCGRQSQLIDTVFCRPLGQLQPNGDVGSNGMPHPPAMHSGAAARSADPTAHLPDDVFGPDDLRSVEQKFPNMRAAGLPSANNIPRGEADAGMSEMPCCLVLVPLFPLDLWEAS